MAPPKMFVDLSSAYNSQPDSFVNIIGVVVDVLPPSTINRNGQYMFTFKVLDPQLRDSAYGSQGLRVRFFKHDLHSLPRIRQHGDVVLIRNIKMTSFNQQPLALSNFQTSVLAFPVESIPEPGFEIAYQGNKRLECHGVPLDVEKLSLAEQAYVIQLKHDLKSTIEALPASSIDSRSNGGSVVPPALAAPTAPAAMRKRAGDDLASAEPKRPRDSSFGNKFRLVEELRHFNFADICGQVVKIFPTKYGACDLYVTDYTANKDMFYYAPPEETTELERDGDTFGYTGPSKKAWPGPYGWLVLKINAKDPHAYYANREVEEGDFILLRNVKMKVRLEGAQLDGDMWPDNLNPEKVQIVKLKHQEYPEVKAILLRKERYWATRAAKVGRSVHKQKPTKTEKKRQKKERKAEEAAAAEARKSRNEQSVNISSERVTNGRTKADVNPHVRCGNEEVPISTVRYILDPKNERHTNSTSDERAYVLPFVNAKYRASVRVVGFCPSRLEDFVIPENREDIDISENSAMVDWQSTPKYEWSFSLLLEDTNKPKVATNDFAAYDRMWVHLGHEEAQYLFGNNVEDPQELQSDSRLLAKLREKLCILWGNLEEKADGEQISNRAFECCLMEYGAELDDDDPEKENNPFGFKRHYRMFGVTIL